MRESIGGTMLFWIVLFFLSIFIFFLAFVMKYAYVYKIKNSMINYIERQEGIKTKSAVRTQLTKLGYPTSSPYFICKNTSSRGVYYTLELNSIMAIPIVYIAIPVKISGETRTIQTGLIAGNPASSDIDECSDVWGD